jgi:hypothetical protein
MRPATRALATFRRRDEESAAPLPALFVLEPEMSATAAVTASWSPASSLQVLGATDERGLAAGRATIERAVREQAVRTLVLCGEGTVRPDQARDRERLLAACAALRDDPGLGGVLRASGVAVEALWFDRREGDVYLWDVATRRFELLTDLELERFFAEIQRRADAAHSLAAGR